MIETLYQVVSTLWLMPGMIGAIIFNVIPFQLRTKSFIERFYHFFYQSNSSLQSIIINGCSCGRALSQSTSNKLSLLTYQAFFLHFFLLANGDFKNPITRDCNAALAFQFVFCVSFLSHPPCLMSLETQLLPQLNSVGFLYKSAVPYKLQLMKTNERLRSKSETSNVLMM